MSQADGTAPDRSAPSPPAAAIDYFGLQLPLVTQLAAMLADDAVVRGLIGPREAARVWDRHLLNCAVIGELVPTGARVVDVGSGAGLPGLVLACSRPDVRIDLVEPLQRRADFLREACEALGLTDRVHVVRGRAPEQSVVDAVGSAGWITARAVAPLARLAQWCAPLLAVGGRLLAMKGARAEAEVAQARPALRGLRLSLVGIQVCGAGIVEPPTSVVVMERTR
jgi:16S rRNA (guanine527-N7)-methyltransferase